MSIIPSNNSSTWATVKSYLKWSPVAAALSITPVYSLMANKSALQLGELPQRMSATERVKGGLKLAPIVGTIVGVQMELQKVVEKKLYGDKPEKTLADKLKSSAIVGTLSAPLLAIFNGTLRKKSAVDILKGLKSPLQVGAIAMQETAFVGGISGAEKVIAELKRRLGDNKIVECAGAFFSGVAGALAGHPANTALTRWQENKEIQPKKLMAGASHRALATGIFVTLLTLIKKTFG